MAQSSLSTGGSNSLQYVSVDYNSHRDALIQRIRARYPLLWNDFLQGNYGTIFLDYVAWSLSTGAYTTNRVAAENFTGTMQLRESAVRLGNLVLYKLAQPSPSTILCDASIASIATEDTLLTEGTPMKTANPTQTFEVLTDYTIPAGQVSPQTLTASFNPNAPGSRTIASLLSFTSGSQTVQCLDTTVNLQAYVSAGQWVQPSSGDPAAQILSIDSDSNGNYDIMNLAQPWTGQSGTFTANVYERRVQVVQGQTYILSQVAPVSTTRMTIVLAASPVIDQTVTVTVNGVTWTETLSLGLNSETDLVFETRVIPSTGDTSIIFGDGVRGALVPAQANLSISYRVGGGLAGNVPVGAINVTVPVVGVATGAQYILGLINNTPGSGGQDAEDLETARQAIPASTVTGQRAVTRTDYETLAGQYSGPSGSVSFARATTRGGNTLLEGNLMIVYAWTTVAGGGLTPVQGALKGDLQAYLQTVAVGTDYVLMADGTSQPLPFSCQIAVSPGNDPQDTAEAVQQAVDGYVTGLIPGTAASYAAMIQAALNTTGVGNIVVATPQTDVYPQNIDTVFIAPSSTIAYTPDLLSSSPGLFIGQLSFTPNFAWSLTGTYGGLPISISPDVTVGFARLSGTGLDPNSISQINLNTGQVILRIIGPLQALNLYLSTVQPYTLQRPTDIYVSYDGDNSQAQRRLIRANLRYWIQGLAVGAPLYAVPPPTPTPNAAVSAFDVVSAVSGVTDVTVSLNSPSNPSPRLDVNEFEIVVVKEIYINSLSD